MFEKIRNFVLREVFEFFILRNLLLHKSDYSIACTSICQPLVLRIRNDDLNLISGRIKTHCFSDDCCAPVGEDEILWIFANGTRDAFSDVASHHVAVMAARINFFRESFSHPLIESGIQMINCDVIPIVKIKTTQMLLGNQELNRCRVILRGDVRGGEILFSHVYLKRFPPS